MLKKSIGYKTIIDWLATGDRRPFAFQEETWGHILAARSGLVNAPTGCGKTYSVFLGALIDFINRHPEDHLRRANNGLQLLWISPLRALAKDIGRAMEEVIAALGLRWQVGIRNGDTDPAERQRQKRKMPEILIITPESLHLLLAQKGYGDVFRQLRIIAVDEWHELLGSKRGVQVELAISRIMGVKQNDCTIIGISATIGNLDQARDVLLASLEKAPDAKKFIVRANIPKPIVVTSILPDEIEKYPWAGHLGLRLIDKVIPILEGSRTTLIFINTRGMSERWYQSLLDTCPDLAGAIALHHGSIDMALRNWVEEVLHEGKLKAVVTTASLDLGVDFRPVETVVQVGSPKGVARFLQRAGRSGHQPGEISRIWFLPTHSLELMEAAALKSAMAANLIESREPMILCFDVLIQYLCTIAISDGFYPADIFAELKMTYCYRDMTEGEWNEILLFITAGGAALHQYDEFKKVEITEEGLYRITGRRTAMHHRLHIGTIVSDSMLKVRFVTGGYVGVIEEYFISRLSPGDAFTLAGRVLEFVMIKDMTALVRKSSAKKAIVPSWNGGRMPLSANLGMMLRKKLDEAAEMLLTPVAAYGRGSAGDPSAATGPGRTGNPAAAGPATSPVPAGTGNPHSGTGHPHSAAPDPARTGNPAAAGPAKAAVPIGPGSTPPASTPHPSPGNQVPAAPGNPRPVSATAAAPGTQQPIASPTADAASGPATPATSPFDIEIQVLRPLFELQSALSYMPRENELLIEQIETKDGFHLFVYPFEGRLVHEAMAALLAYRISRETPITFSFAMNDYGFELLSDQPIPVDDSNVYELFSPIDLTTDIQRSVNSAEMARRKFRDIAVIGGLIFQGYPGDFKKTKHLQSSASLLFNVFAEYDPNNLLIRQAYNEVMDQQMEEVRLRNMLERIQRGRIVLRWPTRLTPFCFPLKVDSMREDLSSEKLEDRVRKMQAQLR